MGTSKVGVQVNTSKFSGDHTLYIESHQTSILAVFAMTGLLSCVTCSLAMVAMTRTKKIAFSTKFLSCSLLIFDCLFIVVSTSRKFAEHPTLNVNLHVTSMIWIQLSFMTVAIMSFERYLLFVWPERYPMLCSKKAVTLIALTLWGFQTLLTLAMRYITCTLANGSWSNVTSISGYCNNIMTVYYMVFVLIFLSVSITSYGHIIKIIRDKTLWVGQTVNLSSTLNILKRYQSTSLVLIYVISITATSSAYFVILVYIRCFNLGIYDLRLSTEIVSIVNCLLDPFLYVLWFRETRMEMLKICSLFNHRFLTRAEVMRYDVYDIVTSVKRKRYNRIHPGPPRVAIRHIRVERIEEHIEVCTSSSFSDVNVRHTRCDDPV